MRNVEMKAPLLALLLTLSLFLYTSHGLKQASVAQLPALVARPEQRNLIDTVHSNKTVLFFSLSLSFSVWELAVSSVSSGNARERNANIVFVVDYNRKLLTRAECRRVRGAQRAREREVQCAQTAVVGWLVYECVLVCVCAINKCMQLHLPESALPLSLSLYFFCVIVWGTLRHMPLSPPGSYLFSTFNISNNYKISYNL